MAGRFLVAAAAVLWSTSGLFVKSPAVVAIGGPEVRGPVVACTRVLVAALVLAPLVRRAGVRWRPGLVPLAASFAVMNLLFVSAMTMADAGDVIFLQYTAPLWVALVGVWWLREPLARSDLVALAAGLAGVAAIGWGALPSGRWAGALLALGSGVGYAGVVLGLRVLRDEDATWLVALCMAASGLVLVPWVLARGVLPGVSAWAWVAGLGALQMALPYVLFARGLRTVPAQEAALLTLVEPVLNPLWVRLAWGEPVAAHTWAGGGLILGGLVLRYWGPRPRASMEGGT
ncbi:MAG: EamA family transporter [Planctomycetes bacterium]|nr:EamA family transporter [Planctomycetota bacterium]